MFSQRSSTTGNITFGVDFHPNSDALDAKIVLKAKLGDETHLLGSGKLCKSQLSDGFGQFSPRLSTTGSVISVVNFNSTAEFVSTAISGNEINLLCTGRQCK